MNKVKNTKYRFTLVNGGDRRRVNPLGTQNVTHERQEGTYFYQQNISSLKFNDDEGDFSWIKAIEEAGNICGTLYLEIERKCQSAPVATWSLFARSEWTIQNCEFINSKCTVTISPDPTGSGKCLLDRMNDSIDMFEAVDDTVTPGADGFCYPTDWPHADALGYDNGRIFFYNDPAFHTVLIRTELDGLGNPTLPPTVEEMQAAAAGGIPEAELDHIQITRVGRYQEFPLSPAYVFYVAWAYRWLEPKVGGICKEAPKGYTLVDDAGPNCLFQKKPTTEDMSLFTSVFDRCNNIGIIPTDASVVYSLALPGNPDYPEGFCLYVPHKDTTHTFLTLSLQRALEEFGKRCGITNIVSDYFQINPDNPSTTNYVTGEDTHTSDVRFIQKGNAIFPLLSNARTGLMTWDDLTGILEEAYQCYWSIDADGSLRYEHVSYYDNVVIGLDLTQDKFKEYVNKEINYSYKKDLLPFIETIADDGNSHNYNWEQQDIKYIDPSGQKLSCVGTQSLDRSFGIFATDLDYYLEYPTDSSRSGWVMVACENSLANPNAIPFDNLPNGHLSTYRLVQNYYNNNRSAEIGQINGVDTIFASSIKTKEQEGLAAPVCCEDNFDPRENVKTPVGIGRVVSTEQDLMTDKLTLKTEY